MVQYQANGFVEKLAYMLVRPPRFTYNHSLLKVSHQRWLHETYYVEGIELTLYLPKNNQPRYVILYLHGNSSSRLEVKLFLNMLPLDVGVACFDFKGCGNRFAKDKEFVEFLTLGKN